MHTVENGSGKLIGKHVGTGNAVFPLGFPPNILEALLDAETKCYSFKVNFLQFYTFAMGQREHFTVL